MQEVKVKLRGNTCARSLSDDDLQTSKRLRRARGALSGAAGHDEDDDDGDKDEEDEEEDDSGAELLAHAKKLESHFLPTQCFVGQMITLGGNAELELVDSMDPFSEGIIFSVMPPKKSWRNISNLFGGEKVTDSQFLSALALVFALHIFKMIFIKCLSISIDNRSLHAPPSTSTLNHNLTMLLIVAPSPPPH
ncbi:hypothetical protein EI94DRAFT_1152244 [Lactarius quietus]|nr:hypothetical protein EI94DRAFT_1152244 [Lactarius quietus]